jgi:hypothetical protein
MADQPETKVPNILLAQLPILATRVLLWPLRFPSLLMSMNVGHTAAALGGVGAAYYFFGNPLEVRDMALLKGYLLAGVVQTAVLEMGTVDTQLM